MNLVGKVIPDSGSVQTVMLHKSFSCFLTYLLLLSVNAVLLCCQHRQW